jgi:hypothetical protein
MTESEQVPNQTNATEQKKPKHIKTVRTAVPPKQRAEKAKSLAEHEADLEIYNEMIQEKGPLLSLTFARDKTLKKIHQIKKRTKNAINQAKAYSESMADQDRALDREIVAALTPLDHKDREMLAEICTITHPAVLDEKGKVITPEHKELNKHALIREGRLMTVLNRVARGKKKKGDGATVEYINKRNEKAIEDNDVRGSIPVKL